MMLVLVSDGPPGRLYLVFNQEQVGKLAFMFGFVPLIVVLVIIYLTTWLTYRASRRALSPVIALAKAVRDWDPKHPDLAALDPQKPRAGFRRRRRNARARPARIRHAHRGIRRTRAQFHARCEPRIAQSAHRDQGRRRRAARGGTVAVLDARGRTHPPLGARHGSDDRSVPDPRARIRHGIAARRISSRTKRCARKSSARSRCSKASPSNWRWSRTRHSCCTRRRKCSPR